MISYDYTYDMTQCCGVSHRVTESALQLLTIRPNKKKHVSLVKLFLQNCRGHAAFFLFLLVRFINRGKRSEMVSVVSRYERNEI